MFEMADDFLQLMTETKPQIQQIHRTRNNINNNNKKNSTPRRIIVKLQRTKRENLDRSQRKENTFIIKEQR